MIFKNSHSTVFDVHKLYYIVLNYMHFICNSSVLFLLEIKNTYIPRITYLCVFTS